MSEPNGVAMPQARSHHQFNGINSNQGSRESSPVPRVGLIPASQLPPVRANIPASQLPPTRNTVSGLTQKVGQLSVSNQHTPKASPSKFVAFPPHEEKPKTAVFSDNPSPVVSNSQTVLLNPVATSDIVNKNVTLTSNTNSEPTNVATDSQGLMGSNQIPRNSPSRYFNNSPSFNLNGPSNHNSFDKIVSRPSFQRPQHVQAVNQPSGPLKPAPLSFPQQQQIPPIKEQSKSIPSFPQDVLASNQIPPSQPTSFNRLPNPAPKVGVPASHQPQIPGTQSFPNNRPALASHLNNQKPSFQNISNASPYPPQMNLQQESALPVSNSNLNPQIQPSPLQNVGKPLRPRYPQTLPPNSTQPQNAGLPYNTGPPNRNVMSNQSGYSPNQSQFNVPQGMPVNQQVNYNSGPTQLNYPPNVPQTGPLAQTQLKSGIAGNRYPGGQQTTPQHQNQQNLNQFGYTHSSQVIQTGFNRLWGTESHDLLQLPQILPPTKLQPPQVNLGQETLNQANCSPEVFRSTMTKIPETASLLQKARLPLGLLIHPFKDLSYLPVIQCNVIVRCRACRTYINPFVTFVDSKRWKCNLCYRINELPEEFQYDPVSKTYGDPSRRPEIKQSTIEYIAPSEYMLRPPQPAVYLFLLDVSRMAVESGYLEVFCNILLEELKNLPGDARTEIGFLAYDSALHFFSLMEGLSQPHEMTILDIDDVFLPTPDNLLVNLKDTIESVEDLLHLLPKRFSNTYDGNSALGAALQIAHKMMAPTGGRITVLQSSLPNIGPGAVVSREDPNQRSSTDVAHLNPANDFYKKLALDCSAQQIAVDLFIVNSQYVDVATISGISRFSGGCIHHFPLFKSSRPLLVDGFQKSLRRYLTRKIGFEAVMRVRCTRGLSIHTFHGNFFVRSTDLLSLPNTNPDSAFGMQVAIEENLTDCQTVCFQAALLYTSSKGERRIRVHTLCLPVVSTLSEVIHSADQQCVIGLLGKMAVDRSLQSSLSDAREAFINAAIDSLTAYKFSLNMGSSTSGLLAPECLKLFPLYIAAILKHPAFRTGTSTRLDDRVKAMIDMKTKPLHVLIQNIYPDLYPIHNLEQQEVVLNGEEEPIPMPPRLQLTARSLENKGAFLMDCGEQMLILVGPNVSKEFLNESLGVSDYSAIPDNMYDIPIMENQANQRLHQFINYLNDEKPYIASLQLIRDNNPNRIMFLENLIEDRLENSLSYHEFLQHIKTQVK